MKLYEFNDIAINEIFRFLSAKDLLNLSKTCSKFDDIIRRNLAWGLQVDMDSFDTANEMLEFCDCFGKDIIKIRFPRKANLKQHTKVIAKTLENKMLNTIDIHFSETDMKFFNRAILEKFRRLIDLTISYRGRSFDLKRLLYLIRKKNLQKLKVTFMIRKTVRDRSHDKRCHRYYKIYNYLHIDLERKDKKFINFQIGLTSNDVRETIYNKNVEVMSAHKAGLPLAIDLENHRNANDTPDHVQIYIGSEDVCDENVYYYEQFPLYPIKHPYVVCLFSLFFFLLLVSVFFVM